MARRRSADGARHSVVAGRDAGVSAAGARRAAAVRRARRTRCAHNYEAIGGRSPLTDITMRAGGGAARAARARRFRSPSACATGSRSSRTRSRELAAAGVTRVIGIPLAPQFSTLSVQKYIDAATGGAAGRHAVRARSSRFTRIRCCSTRSPSASARRAPKPDEHVVFTAHSLPERVIEAGDRYADEVAATARGVAARAGIATLRHRVSERGTHAGAVDRPGARRADRRARRPRRPQVPGRADRLRLRPHRNSVRHRRAGRRRPRASSRRTLRRTESLNTSPTVHRHARGSGPDAWL